MKKHIAFAIATMFLVTLFTGCNSDSLCETGVSHPTECVYHSLKYEGMDVNPQHHFAKYEVSQNKDFVSEVWEAINYEKWDENNEDMSTAAVAIWLTFLSDDEAFRVSIDPNDKGSRIDSISDEFLTEEQMMQPNPETHHYFNLPKGTYDKISKLLTDYTEEHFNDSLSLEAMYHIMKGYDRYTFSSGETYFQIPSEYTGDFISQWQLDSWVPFTLKDGEALGGQVIEIHHTPSELSIGVFTDTLNVYIENKGVGSCYKITDEIATTIQQQFNEFEKVSEKE